MKAKKDARKRSEMKRNGPTRQDWRDARHDEDSMDKVHRLELRELMIGTSAFSTLL